MKVADVQARTARFNVAYREAMFALRSYVELVPEGQDVDPEIPESYAACRTRLMEALFWQRNLHQILVTKTDEGQKALKEYADKMEQQAKEQKVKSEAEDAAPEGGAPNLHFVTEAPDGK